MRERRDKGGETVNHPPLHDRNLTLACGYGNSTDQCGQPAAWHLSWYQHDDYDKWENSLACEDHKVESVDRWDVGWRHRVNHACAMPGARLHLDHGLEDEDGLPISYCYHPFDNGSVLAVETMKVPLEEKRDA